MNILLLNLTRFGDLLQTQPVIAELNRQGHRVGLVCLDNFAPATELLNGVTDVYPMPGSRFLAACDRGWLEGTEAFWKWARDVAGDFRADAVLSLTPTLSVRLLARFFAGTEAGAATVEGAGNKVAAAGGERPVLGFGLDSFGFGFSSSPWSSFLQASSNMRGCSPFNLVDLFWRCAGLGDGERVNALRAPGDSPREAVRSILESEGPSGASGYVAVQLGASMDRRRWPVERYAAFARSMWEERGLCPVLLGSPGESGLGEKFAQKAGEAGGMPFVNLIGRTDIPQLAAALLECRMLATNDTGTMHLAAGLGVPVIAVFLATAQPWDTGPYRAGTCSLEPDMPCHPCPFGKPCPSGNACRRSVSARTMIRLALHRLDTGQWAGVDREHLAGARVWESAVQEHGFMGLSSLSGHEAEDRTRWVRIQRHFYRQFLDRDETAPFPEPHGLTDEGAAEVRDSLSRAMALLHLCAEQGELLRVHPREALKRKFMGTWQMVHTLWDDDRWFNVLGYLWSAQSQESGNDLDGILELVGRYRRLVASWLELFS